MRFIALLPSLEFPNINCDISLWSLHLIFRIFIETLRFSLKSSWCPSKRTLSIKFELCWIKFPWSIHQEWTVVTSVTCKFNASPIFYSSHIDIRSREFLENFYFINYLLSHAIAIAVFQIHKYFIHLSICRIPIIKNVKCRFISYLHRSVVS